MRCWVWFLACGALACSDPDQGANRDGEGGQGGGGGDAGGDAGQSSRCSDLACDPNASCDDDGSPECVCNEGYQGDGESCTDIDECASGAAVCGQNAECIDLNGSYRCDCEPLFGGDPQVGCEGLCEIAMADPAVCGESALCRIDRAAVCDACQPGFVGDGSTCTAASDCPEPCDGDGAGDIANTTCTGAAGARTCACAPGFGGDPASACTDQDECAADSGGCGENATCLNTAGGHFCDCLGEFQRTASGECEDTDECADATLNDCSAHATCVNDTGGYRCECKAPFAGDASDGCYCELSGFWAMRQDLDTCWCDRDLSAITVISAGTVEATVWELHKYSYDGSVITVEKKGCGSDTTPDLVSSLFGETYSSYVPDEFFFDFPLQPALDVPAPELAPGSMFETPDEAAVVGMDLGSDPVNAVWPASQTGVNAVGGAAPAWHDTDGDGVPGLTVWPRPPSEFTKASAPGAVKFYSYLPLDFMDGGGGRTVVTERAGCVSLATRVVTKLEAEVEDCEKLVGNVVNLKTDGRVYGCTQVAMADWDSDITCGEADWDAATMCDRPQAQRLDDQDQSQQTSASFELIKIGALGDTVDCADVRAALPAIERDTPSPRTCTCP